MIKFVKTIGESDSCFHYLREDSRNKQVQDLTAKLWDGIEFKPGINIVIGENGCGKSTLLNIIRQGNLLTHSFIPKKSRFPITDVENLDKIYKCFVIKQDLRIPVFNLYRMSEDSHKLASNEIADKTELTQFLGLKEESKGQNVKGDLSQLFHIMFERTSECYPLLYYAIELAKTFPAKDVSDTPFIKDVNGEALLDTIKSNGIECKEPMYTILMDEPDVGLDVENLKDIYNMLSTQRPDTQVIAVIHNPLLIYKLSKLDYVNIIEMSKNYLSEIKNFLEN